jgi:hypothetical protein
MYFLLSLVLSLVIYYYYCILAQKEILQGSETSRSALWPIWSPSNRQRGSFPGVKRPGPEIHNVPPSAEVKNEWNYTSIPPIRLYVVERDRFNFSSSIIIVIINLLPPLYRVFIITYL